MKKKNTILCEIGELHAEVYRVLCKVKDLYAADKEGPALQKVAKVLPPDDWKVGIYVTVVSPRRQGGLVVDRSGMSDIFEVMAVNYPCVALRYASGCVADHVGQWNATEYCFAQVSDDYVAAMKKDK